jgi:hypothetical protein
MSGTATHTHFSLGNAAKALCYKPEVARSSPDEVNDFFNCPNPSSCTVPGVCSASNKNEYQKQKNNFSWEQSSAGA